MLLPDILHMIIDFGLVVLIWLVQWIIYPSFLEIETKRFALWHRSYVVRISIVVFPLMTAQLVLALYRVYASFHSIWLMYLILVLVIWVLTFGRADALHNRLERMPGDDQSKRALIRLNLPRAILWTVCFFLNMTLFVLGG